MLINEAAGAFNSDNGQGVARMVAQCLTECLPP